MRTRPLLLLSIAMSLLLIIPSASAQTVTPTITIVAPAISTTLNVSAKAFFGVNMSILFNGPTPYVENVTKNSSIVQLGPRCLTPGGAEIVRTIWANLTFSAPTDYAKFAMGGTCWATVNMANFFWNYANASYAAYYHVSSWHLALTGTTATALMLAYENYIGQVRFFSVYAVCNTGIYPCGEDQFLNIDELNVTPIQPYLHNLGNATGKQGLTTFSRGGNGSYNYNESYWDLPASGATYASDMWRFTESADYCIINQLETPCTLWFGQAQDIFYGEPHSGGGIGGGGGGSGGFNYCSIAPIWWSLLLVLVPVAVMVVLTEIYGNPKGRKK